MSKIPSPWSVVSGPWSTFRRLAGVLFLTATAFAAVPDELATALKSFRADPPPGWSYTLTSVGEGRSMVERCDATKPDFERWSLVEKDGRPPTPTEAREYAEGRTRRSRGGTAPKFVEQLDLTTVTKIGESAERITFQCRLKPGDDGDKVAAFLRATIVVHRPTQTVETIELGSTGEFSPIFVVRIAEMKTRLTYTSPTADRPTLPARVETHVRGRAFLFKSLDEDMTVTFSDYEPIRRK
jgi:hypothetical protein